MMKMEKTYSIFRSKGNKDDFLAAYDETLKLWPVPFEELMISTRFGMTHIIVSGPKDAPALILFHAMTYSATEWYPNVQSLAAGYRVYAVDTVGDFGKSTVTSIIKSREDAVNWISDLLYGLGIQSAVFMGHSIGGWHVMNFAISSPERVEKMILLAPASGIQKLTPIFFFKIYPAVLFPSEARFIKQLSWFVSKTFKPTEQSKRLIRQFVVSGVNCMPQTGLIPSVFQDAELQRLTMPALLLVGEHEVIYDYQKMLTRAKRLMPHIQTRIIPNAGHLLNIEQHEMVNDTVSGFLNIDSKIPAQVV
jgi:pimeloyl-ACP methyl ester carboxylesterase